MENKKIEDLMKQAEEFAKSIGYDSKLSSTEKDLPLKSSILNPSIMLRFIYKYT